jgi:uncharacterized protein YjbI with pentapeptide repeats
MRKPERESLLFRLSNLNLLAMVLVVSLFIVWFFSAVKPIPILVKQTWIGFGEDTTRTDTVETTKQSGRGISTKESSATNHQSAKTVWDLLGLFGTLAIPVVLYQFQYQEQKRADKRNEIEQEIAAKNLREEALKDYIDKMAELLIDKELKNLLGDFLKDEELKKLLNSSRETTPQYSPRLDAVLDIARARTLSILRQLDSDKERKNSVVQFLIDAELIQGLDLLKGADLSRTILGWAILGGANLEGANLEGANLKLANLYEANLYEANLKKATLKLANLEGTILYEANLEGANLEWAILKRADLKGAKLGGANLGGANLYDAILKGAILKGAILKGAILEGADLEGADLEGADLEWADLEWANLKGAILKGAILKGAILKGAILEGANLEDVKGLTLENITRSKLH